MRNAITCLTMMLTAAVAFPSSSVPTLSLGPPVFSSNGEIVIPVFLDAAGATDISAWAISIRADETVIDAVTLQRADGDRPAFETTARGKSTVTYVAWSKHAADGITHIADIHVPPNVEVKLDPELTTLSDAAGIHERSVANGELQFSAPDGSQTRRHRASDSPARTTLHDS